MMCAVMIGVALVTASTDPAAAGTPEKRCGTAGYKAHPGSYEPTIRVYVRAKGPVSCKRARKIVNQIGGGGQAPQGWSCKRDASENVAVQCRKDDARVRGLFKNR